MTEPIKRYYRPAEPHRHLVVVTPRQLEVLELIGSGVTKYRDLAKALDVSSENGVGDHVLSLERKELVTRGKGKSGGLALTDLGWRYVGPCEHMARSAIAKLVADLVLVTDDVPPLLYPKFCPWCGRRIPPGGAS